MNPAHYSFSWANGVVEKLRRKYARATDTVEAILAISDRDLAKYLANADPVFPKLRDMIHIADNWIQRGANLTTNPTQLACFLTTIRYRTNQRILDRLDAVNFCGRLEEQGSRGGGGAERSEAIPPVLTSSGGQGNGL